MRRIALLVSGVLAHASVSAATFVVTQFGDPPVNGCTAYDCTLREAVLAANATAAADVIVLQTGTYALTSYCAVDTPNCLDLDITQPLTIEGQGSGNTEITTTIPSNVSPNIADVGHTRLIEASAPLTLRNLRLRKGFVRSSLIHTGSGGCLLVQGAASVLENVVVAECRATSTIFAYGGGIAIIGAVSQWQNVTVRNSDADYGGGVHVRNGDDQPKAQLLGNNVLITANRARYGGGVNLERASMSLEQGSRITRNSADMGGGLNAYRPAFVRGSSKSLLEISGNLADTESCGGALIRDESSYFNFPTRDIALSHLRVEDNVAKKSGGGLCITSLGGAPLGTVSIQQSAFARNTAGQNGGGLLLNSAESAPYIVLDQLSLWQNGAARGGALRSYGAVALRHVSSYANSSSGGAIDIGGKSSIAFTTSLGDTGSIDTSGSVELAASVMTSKCTGSVSDSGNNFVLQSIGCPGESTTTDRLGLAFGDYGGPYPVVGIAQAPSVLRDLLAPIAGEPDVRGWLRQNQLDVGAHEYDAIAP
jgi:CSLREA domain-containing protein